jgi:hypothetical protein
MKIYYSNNSNKYLIMVTFDDIPSEILLEIGSYLNFQDCYHLSTINNSWNNLFNNQCCCLSNYLKNPHWKIFNDDSHHSLMWIKHKQYPHEFNVSYIEFNKSHQNNDDYLCDFIESQISINDIPKKSYADALTNGNMFDKIKIYAQRKYQFKEVTDVYSNGSKIRYITKQVTHDYDYGFCLYVWGTLISDTIVNLSEFSIGMCDYSNHLHIEDLLKNMVVTHILGVSAVIIIILLLTDLHISIFYIYKQKKNVVKN